MKRLLSNRIQFLYCYLSISVPIPSSSFLTLATSSSLSKPTVNCNLFPLDSSFLLTRMTSSLSSSSNNIGLTEIGGSSSNSNTEPVTIEGGSEKESNSMSDNSSWREKIEISIAKSRKVRGGNYVQIATVDPTTLEPRCRTVVFRGFLKPDKSKSHNDNQQQEQEQQYELPMIMKMITDKRSNKFQEVTQNNNDSPNKSTNSAEMVWWFAKSSEQYRIRGQLKFVGEDESDEYLLQCRKEQWGNLSDPAREQFYWEDPGLDYPVGDSEGPSLRHKVPTGGRDDDGKVLPPPSTFLLMLLIPKRCDYLRLGDNYRQIDNLLEDDQWKYSRVNP